MVKYPQGKTRLDGRCIKNTVMLKERLLEAFNSILTDQNRMKKTISEILSPPLPPFEIGDTRVSAMSVVTSLETLGTW